MPVYVDNMHETKMGSLGRMKMSHMVSESEEELHKMAKDIGVARKWFQQDHYDICLSKRKKAVSLGAIEITMRDAVDVVKKFRENINNTTD